MKNEHKDITKEKKSIQCVDGKLDVCVYYIQTSQFIIES